LDTEDADPYHTRHQMQQGHVPPRTGYANGEATVITGHTQTSRHHGHKAGSNGRLSGQQPFRTQPWLLPLQMIHHFSRQR
jgi:hypothetical protein